VAVANTGTGSVTVTQANVTGVGFGYSGLTLPITLGPGDSISFDLTFKPTASGNVSGGIAILSNATNSPGNESLTGTGVHAASLSWQATSTAGVSYNVYRGGVSGGPYAKVGSVSGTSYMDMSVASGATYYYVITAVGSNNQESGYSNQVRAAVPST
jgi:hypothetical protein